MKVRCTCDLQHLQTDDATLITLENVESTLLDYIISFVSYW